MCRHDSHRTGTRARGRPPHRRHTGARRPADSALARIDRAQAPAVAEIVSQAVDVKCVPDERTNSVLVLADDESLRDVERLIGSLDQLPRAPLNQLPIRVFKLKNLFPGPELENAVRLTVSEDAKWAFNPRTTILVVSADERSLANLEGVLKEFDVPVPPRAKELPDPARRIRVVWLANQKPDTPDDVRPVPSDLKSVVDELAKLGVTDLSLAAQTIILTQIGTEFDASSTLPTANLTVSGQMDFGTADDGDRVRITLQATPPKGPSHPVPVPAPGQATEPTRQILLKTTIVARLGQAVVLGVAPYGADTSAFVIQVLPGD